MSLLDTFALLFETDADEAADSIGNLSDSLDEAGQAGGAAAAGVNKAAASAGQGTSSFLDMAKSAVGLVAAFVSVGAVGSAFMNQALETDRLGKFTEALGLNIAEVDAWGAAVALNGGSADSFRGSVESLNNAMGDIALGGGGDIAQTLGRLGVSALDATGRIKQVTELLPELADAFQNLSKRESVAFGQKLGLDQGTILLLQQGRAAVSGLVEQQRQLGGRTEEGYKASAAFNDEMSNTGRIFTGITDTASQTILPFFTKMLKGFQGIVAWVREHSEVVGGFFVAVAGVLTAVYLPAMYRAAAATIAATWPFLAIGAAVVAFGALIGLLYEDVKAYIGGQSSFVGDLAKKYEWFGKLLDGVIGGVRFLIKEFSEFGVKMFDNIGNAIEFYGQLVSMVFGASGEKVEGFSNIASAAVDIIIAAFKLLGSVISGTLDFIASPIDSTASALNFLAEKMSGLFDAAADSTKGISDAFKAMGDIIASVLQFILSPIDAMSDALASLGDMLPNLTGIADMVTSGWSNIAGMFGGEDSESGIVQLQKQSEAALSVSTEANSNPVLAGGSVSNRVSYVSQSNQFSTKVDARGMSKEDATATFSEQRTRELAQAKGFLDDGVAY